MPFFFVFFFSRPNHPVNLLSLRNDGKSVRYLDKVDFPAGSDVLPYHQLVCLSDLGIYIELSSMVMLIVLANCKGIKQIKEKMTTLQFQIRQI
jgi:hypothetical protein